MSPDRDRGAESGGARTTQDSAGSVPAGCRVILFIRGAALGGAERQAILLADHLRHRVGAEAGVWCFEGGEGRAAAHLAARRIPLLVHPADWGCGALRKSLQLLRLALALRRARPEIILPFTNDPNKVCGAIWRVTGARASIWNQRDEGRRTSGRAMERLAIHLTPHFVANSAEGVRYLVDTLGVPSERTEVIPNGVALEPPQLDRGGWRRRLGADEDTLIATMVANVHHFKDHRTLVAAWRRVCERMPERPPLLLLAGRRESAAAEVEAQIGELGLGDRVRMLGEVEDVSGLLAASDLAVFSSTREGLPNAVLEAMAAGLPVVATRITGTEEALGEASPGLVPAGDPAALAERVLELAGDPGERSRQGDANRNRAAERFAPRRMLEAYERLIARWLR